MGNLCCLGKRPHLTKSTTRELLGLIENEETYIVESINSLSHNDSNQQNSNARSYDTEKMIRKPDDTILDLNSDQVKKILNLNKLKLALFHLQVEYSDIEADTSEARTELMRVLDLYYNAKEENFDDETKVYCFIRACKMN